MVEEDEKSASVMLPRCICNWKSCRSYMRNFRDSEPPHEIFNGVVKMKFKQGDEKSTKLKEAWDRYLQPEDSKRENWKDGEIKYHVARHHFTETLIREHLGNKKNWDWTALVAADDAEVWLFELSEEDSCLIPDTEEIGYLKVPNVSKQHVKSFASTWTLENPPSKMEKQGSDSNLSVVSSKSTSKSPQPGVRKQKNKVKAVGDAPNSLAGLKDLPSTSDHVAKSPKPGESARKKKLSSSTHGDESRGRKKTSSDDTSVKSPKSRKKSPKRTTSKNEESASEDNREGKILSLPSNDEAEVKNGHSRKNVDLSGSTADEEIKKLKQEFFEERAKAESALEDLNESKKEVESLRNEVRQLTEARVKDQEARNLVTSTQSSADDSAAAPLQSKVEELTEQNAKLQNLSKKRLEMVTQMETKFHAEINAGLTREKELKAQLSAEVSKAEAAEKEMKKTKEELSLVQKKMEELRESHTTETQDFILSIDNLKSRIASLEEEHSKLLAEMDSGKDTSRTLETTKASEQTKIAELEAEVDQLKQQNRKLAVMDTPSAPDMSLQQAVETLQREKDALAAEKAKLSKLNQNQKIIIRSLEGKVDTDNEEVRRRSRREDELERGAALLANLYFTQKNMENLAEQSTKIDLVSGRDLEDSGNGVGDQALLLKEVMERKQKKWWGSLDGIFAYSNYVEEDLMEDMILAQSAQ